MPTVQTSYKILHRNLVSRLEKKWEKMAKRSSAVLEPWGEGGAGGGGAGGGAGKEEGMGTGSNNKQATNQPARQEPSTQGHLGKG